MLNFMSMVYVVGTPINRLSLKIMSKKVLTILR